MNNDIKWSNEIIKSSKIKKILIILKKMSQKSGEGDTGKNTGGMGCYSPEFL